MGHLNSRLLWHKYAESYFVSGKKIVEIGPSGYPTYYEKSLVANNINAFYQVLDVSKNFIANAADNPNFIMAADALNYPFPKDEFDIVFSDQVLAHVDYFWLWYAELKRITKPGGYIITINSYSYPRCPSPIDAWRVHSDGMKLLNNSLQLTTLLCKTESLEMEQFNITKKVGHYYPGESFQDPHNNNTTVNVFINKMKKNWNSIVGKIPMLRSVLLNPVPVAFDTITIAQKP